MKFTPQVEYHFSGLLSMMPLVASTHGRGVIVGAEMNSTTDLPHAMTAKLSLANAVVCQNRWGAKHQVIYVWLQADPQHGVGDAVYLNHMVFDPTIVGFWDSNGVSKPVLTPSLLYAEYQRSPNSYTVSSQHSQHGSTFQGGAGA